MECCKLFNNPTGLCWCISRTPSRQSVIVREMHHLLEYILSTLTTYVLRQNNAIVSLYLELQAELRQEMGPNGILVASCPTHEVTLDTKVLDATHCWEATADVHSSLKFRAASMPEIDIRFHTQLQLLGSTLVNPEFQIPGSRRSLNQKRIILRMLNQLPKCPMNLCNLLSEPEQHWNGFLELPKFYLSAPLLLIGARSWALHQESNEFQ